MPTWALGLYRYAYFMAGRVEDALRMQERTPRENTGRLYPQWAEVIRDGKAAVYGTGNARKYAKAVTPKDQPDLTADRSIAPVAAGRGQLQFDAEFTKVQVLLSPGLTDTRLAGGPPLKLA